MSAFISSGGSALLNVVLLHFLWNSTPLRADPIAVPAPITPILPRRRPSREDNKLEGIVVDKKTGKGVAGAVVVLADPEFACIRFIRASQSKDITLGARALEGQRGREAWRTVTSTDGRFTITGFSSSSKKHVIGALHEKSGIALRFDLVPSNHLNAPLKIELEEPGYLIATDIPQPFQFDTHGLTVSLAPHSAIDKDPEWDVPARGVLFSLGDFMGMDEQRFGPLPPGNKYFVTYYSFERCLGKAATLFSQSFKLDPGEKKKLSLRRPAGGITLSGRVTDQVGDPLECLNVTVHTGSPDEIAIGTVGDDDGEYKIVGLPAGKHRLEVCGYAQALDGGPSLLKVTRSQTLVLTAGKQSVTLDVDKVRVAGVSPGDVAPELIFKTLDGQMTGISAYVDCEFLMVVFWGTGNQSYVDQLPVFEGLLQKYAKDHFNVLSICLDNEPEKAQAFVESRKIKWPQGIAYGGAKSTIAKYWGVTDTPVTFLVGLDGKVIGRNLSERELDRLIAEEIKKGRSNQSIAAPKEPASSDDKGE